MTSVSLVIPDVPRRDPICGIVQVAAADLMRFLLPDIPAPAAFRINRIMPTEIKDDTWFYLTSDDSSIELDADAIIVPKADFDAFEQRHKVGAGRYVTAPAATPQYPWEDFYAALVSYVHDHGVPASQKDLVNVMGDWFAEHSEKMPDIRTIQRKIAPIWRALHDE